MNTTKRAKRTAIHNELRALARFYQVEEPQVVFDQQRSQYWQGRGLIELDSDVYNQVGRTVIYHEFTHHLCTLQDGSETHDYTFWTTLWDVCGHFDVTYPWHLEYVSGRKYYERYIIPHLPARKKARALFQAREYERLSQAA